MVLIYSELRVLLEHEGVLMNTKGEHDICKSRQNSPKDKAHQVVRMALFMVVLLNTEGEHDTRESRQNSPKEKRHPIVRMGVFMVVLLNTKAYDLLEHE